MRSVSGQNPAENETTVPIAARIRQEKMHHGKGFPAIFDATLPQTPPETKTDKRTHRLEKPSGSDEPESSFAHNSSRRTRLSAPARGGISKSFGRKP